MSRLIPRKVFTLVIIHNHDSILLGLKKRGFGAGKYNGFGGKVEEGETIVDCALREVKEECGLTPTDLRKIGSLEFEFIGKPVIMDVHVFKSQQYTGTVIESEEMKPRWFNLDNIPYNEMWPDDKHWLPLLLIDQKFYGYFLYDNEEYIIDKRIKIMDKYMM